MSKRLQITLTDDGYEKLMMIINDHFNGCANKSTTIEIAICEFKKFLDIHNKKK